MSWRCRYFETWPYKDLLNEYFKAGAKWTLAPKPRMSDKLYNKVRFCLLQYKLVRVISFYTLYDPYFLSFYQEYPLDDELKRTRLAGEGKYILTEAEPCFDAADVMRCGRDIFVQVSHVTNWGGVEWLRRHLAPEYRVHHLNFMDPYAVHIDASFVPLRK